jgi:hypothetical protein
MMTTHSMKPINSECGIANLNEADENRGKTE